MNRLDALRCTKRQLLSLAAVTAACFGVSSELLTTMFASHSKSQLQSRASLTAIPRSGVVAVSTGIKPLCSNSVDAGPANVSLLRSLMTAGALAACCHAAKVRHIRTGRVSMSAGSETEPVPSATATPQGAGDSSGRSSDSGSSSESTTATTIADKPSPAEMRTQLETAPEPPGGYQTLSQDTRSAVSGLFFPDAQELDMDKSMPLEDHIREFREGLFRTALALVVSIGTCLTFYKELVAFLEKPAMAQGNIVKFVQLAPGEFFFVSLKVAVAVGFLLAFPYALFEASIYFTPALTKSERTTVGPVVLASAGLFYAGVAFALTALAPAALSFFISYSADVIESNFSIDQYFEFILSTGFATGIAFQVPVLQILLGLLNILKSEQLFAVWRYVVVASAVIGAVLTPSTDPVTQLLLSGALCGLYFGGAGVLFALGK